MTDNSFDVTIAFGFLLVLSYDTLYPKRSCSRIQMTKFILLRTDLL